MKIAILSDNIHLTIPALDAGGLPIAGQETVRSMTLEQYQKHARDPAFVAAIAPVDRAAIQVRLDLAAQAAAPK